MKIRLLMFTIGGVLGLIVCIAIVILAKSVGEYFLTSGAKNIEHNQSLALKEAKQSIIYVQQFMVLYPDATHSFSYYTGQYGPPTWISEVGLYGRYILTMKIPVKFNEARTSIIDYGEPLFYLNGVDNITILDGGRLEVTQSIYLEFGKEKWNLLLKNNGDISILDDHIQKDNPVSGFEEYWDSLKGVQ